jgi:hypothetical protein
MFNSLYHNAETKRRLPALNMGFIKNWTTSIPLATTNEKHLLELLRNFLSASGATVILLPLERFQGQAGSPLPRVKGEKIYALLKVHGFSPHGQTQKTCRHAVTARAALNYP